jgi:hypothetical protein
MSVAPASNPNEFHFATPEFAGRGNPMSSRILAMREKEQAGLTSTLDDYRALLGSADLTTQDERFLAYIFRDTALARPWVTSLPN